MADGNLHFAYGLFIVALVLTVTLPLFVNFFVPQQINDEYTDLIDELNNDYRDFTGSAPVKEDVWILGGIYTPYQQGGAYGYTKDGWLYGTEIHDYTPTQYASGSTAYSVSNKETIDGIVYDLDYYKYTSVGNAYAGIKTGDIYTNIAFDVDQKSNIFFTPQNKHIVNNSFYYDFSGYRYSFMPLTSVMGIDDNGNVIQYSKNTSSCSIVWYSYYNISEGLAGQLIVNYGGDDGTDRGVAYVTKDTIIQNFTSQTNTAKLKLQFNGVYLNLYLRLDSYYMSTGLSIEECFNNGYWSVMITSPSADPSAYQSTDYNFNVESIFNTAIKLLTFDTAEYGFSPFVGTLCSLIIVIPFYVGLIVVGMEYQKVLIFAGIVAGIQALLSTGIFG